MTWGQFPLCCEPPTGHAPATPPGWLLPPEHPMGHPGRAAASGVPQVTVPVVIYDPGRRGQGDAETRVPASDPLPRPLSLCGPGRRTGTRCQSRVPKFTCLMGHVNRGVYCFVVLDTPVLASSSSASSETKIRSTLETNPGRGPTTETTRSGAIRFRTS